MTSAMASVMPSPAAGATNFRIIAAIQEAAVMAPFPVLCVQALGMYPP